MAESVRKELLLTKPVLIQSAITTPDTINNNVADDASPKRCRSKPRNAEVLVIAEEAEGPGSLHCAI